CGVTGSPARGPLAETIGTRGSSSADHQPPPPPPPPPRRLPPRPPPPPPPPRRPPPPPPPRRPPRSPPPPPPKPPPPPPKPPPPPPPRGARSCASLTRRVRPSSSAPSICSMAVAAALSSRKVTKPKPRERPVSRSVMTLTSSTSPKLSNARRRAASSVSQLRPPTKRRFDISLSLSHRKTRFSHADAITTH